ncbi:MAG: hypothetical protein ACPGYT_05045 [Nitrospirales bacterium]
MKILPYLAQSSRGNESFNLIGQSEGAVGDWVAQLLSQHNFDPQKLNEPGPYTLTHQHLDSGGKYGRANKKGIEELAKYYNNAVPIFEAIRAAYSEASPVRCWPHFFDIATLLTFEQKDSPETATIGVGCSPGDSTYPEPYFYVSLWPYPSQERLPSITEPSFWHLVEFTALILRSCDLVTKINVAKQHSQVTAIIEQGVKESVELLTI